MSSKVESLQPTPSDDPNWRVCVVCAERFCPWSMAPDGQEPVAPPELYTCMWCRFNAKEKKK